MIKRLICIVEGDGECQALPVLIRRLCGDAAVMALDLPPPIRVKRANFITDAVTRRNYLELARSKARDDDGAILVLLDADDDCPAELAKRLFSEIAEAVSPRRVALVLAKREFEAWFLAASESIAGRRSLAAVLDPPADPEAVRDAKGWLRERMVRGRTYSPTVDQPALATLFDYTVARRRSPSLDKFCREVERLIGA